jgi:hypothetical protein
MAGRWLRLTSTDSATKSSVSDRLQHPAAIAYRPAELPIAGPTQFTLGVNRAALGANSNTGAPMRYFGG